MKRTTRRRLTIWGLNLAIVAAAAGLLLLADWDTIRSNFWNRDGVDLADGNWGDLITIGAVNTVKYTAIAFVGGLVLGVLLALLISWQLGNIVNGTVDGVTLTDQGMTFLPFARRIIGTAQEGREALRRARASSACWPWRPRSQGRRLLAT